MATDPRPDTPVELERLLESCESRIVRAQTVSGALIETARSIRQATGWDFVETYLVHGPRSAAQRLDVDHDGLPDDIIFAQAGADPVREQPVDEVVHSMRVGAFLRWDSLTETAPSARAAAAAAAGFQSALFLPIRGLHGPVGMLIFGSRRPFAADRWADQVTSMQSRLMLAFQRRSGQSELSHLWDLSPDLMAVFDLNGTVLEANPAVTQTLGWTLTQLQTIGATGLVHPEEQPMAVDLMGRLVRGEPGMPNVILRVRRSDGAYRTVSVRTVTMTTEASIILVARDVTDLRLLQHENTRLFRAYDFLRRSAQVGRRAKSSSELFHDVCRVAVESAGYRMAWIGLLEPESRILRPVAQAGDTTGYLDGLEIPIDHLDYGSGPLGRALRSGKPAIARDIESDLSMAPWRERVLAAGYKSVAAFPLSLGETIIGNFSVFSTESDWFAEDEVLVLSDIARDVTFSLESLQREQQRTHAESVVRELETRRLRAQRLESIGTLAGGIAHDLNNTLAPILLAVEMLSAKPHDQESGDYLKAIEMSAHRGSALVKQVLGFARGLEGGEHVLVAPARVVRDVAALLMGTLMKDVRIDVSLPADLPGVLAEPTQLHQVLLNLCVNASQAMGGSGILRIRAEVVHVDSAMARGMVGGRPGDFVCFVVSDTGSGIEPEHMDRIFEPFFTTKAQGEGTGLGLSTSLGIIQDHGGFIAVQSTKHLGSTFRVFLPVSLAADTSATIKAGPLSAERGHDELVLLVDDEKVLRDLLKESFERQGYRVEVAEDGAEGVAVFARLKDEVDIVVTDVKMPVMGGVAMLGALQRIQPGVKSIMISGFGEALTDAEAMRPLGVSCVLQKPFDSKALFSAVRAVLDAR